MPRYMNAIGDSVSYDDPARLLWYSAGPQCGFWTDDWDTMGKSPGHGIPCCPHCGSVGFQIVWKLWIDGAERFQNDGNPGYMLFLIDNGETCFNKTGKGWVDQWEDHKDEYRQKVEK